MSGIVKSGQNVLTLQKRMVRKNFVDGSARAQQFEDV